MSDERLAQAARKLLEMASTPVTIGSGHDQDEYVLVPSICLDWLRSAMTPEERVPASHVVIDPKLRFGTPSIAGHRLDASDMADRYWHLGASVQSEILDTYELTHAELIAACFYAAVYGTRAQRKRWKAWLDETWANTGIEDGTDTKRGWWSDGFVDVPLPPHKDQGGRR